MDNQSLLVSSCIQNEEIMTTIIFKNESKAKVYEIISAKNQGCYKEGELIRRVKTDDISKLNQDGQYQVIAKEASQN